MATDRQNALAPGTVIGGYRLDSILGAGGFGITYKAVEEPIGRPVAIKEYLPAGIAFREADGSTIRPLGSTEGETFEWGFSRFRDEARTLVTIDHPNIVRIHRYFEANGTGYLVMAFQDGSSLRDILKSGGPLSEDEILEIVYPLLDGLEAVHAHGFLHRDIKPGNIYIGSDGRPVLIDFGSARQALSSHTRNLTAVVSGGYSPYEQYESGGNQGPWTDIYALGGVMYRCIAGEMPTEAPSRLSAVIAKNNPDPLPSAAEIGAGKYDPDLLAAIDKCLSILEQDRPQTVAELRSLLPAPAADQTLLVSSAAGAAVAAAAASHKGGETTSASSEAPSAAVAAQAAPRRAGKRALMVGSLVAVSMLAAGGAGGYFLKPEDRALASLRTLVEKEQKAAKEATARATSLAKKASAAEKEITRLKDELKIAKAVGGRDASKVAEIQNRITKLEADLKAAEAEAAKVKQHGDPEVLKAAAARAQKAYEDTVKRLTATQASLNATVAELTRLRAQGDANALKRELEAARLAAKKAGEEKTAAAEALKRAEAARQSAEDALARLKGSGKEKALLAELQKARSALSAAQRKIQDSEAALKQARDALAKARQGNSVADSVALAEAQKKLAERESALKAAREELKTANAEIKRLANSGGDVTALQAQLAAARAAADKARRDLAAATRSQAASRNAIRLAQQRQRIAEGRYAQLLRSTAGIRAQYARLQRSTNFLKKRVAYWKCVANGRCGGGRRRRNPY